LWGPRATLSDAVLTQPYTGQFFMGRLHGWVRSLHPRVTVPVAVVAVVWILWRAFRDRILDRHLAMSVVWLLPLIGVFGFAVGYAYPYYRFINVTLAPMLLVGLGAWVLTRPFWWAEARYGSRRRVIPSVGVVVILLGLGALSFRPGLRLWNRQGPWASEEVRVTLAAARAYAGENPARPMVFIIHPNAEVRRAWGLAKQSSNLVLAGLDGSQVARTFVYVGDPRDFLAGRPAATGFPVFDRLSRGFLQDLRAGLRRYPQAPIAFYLPAFNASVPPGADSVEVAAGVEVLRGPGLAIPSVPAARTAGRASESEAARLAVPPGRLADLGHLARVGLGLVVLLAVPGLIAMNWFGLREFPSRLALVPGISITLVTVSGILVTAIHRGPFGVFDGWASLALAVVTATGLALLGRRRSAQAPTVATDRRVAVSPLG
jgi:hypothetical protein